MEFWNSSDGFFKLLQYREDLNEKERWKKIKKKKGEVEGGKTLLCSPGLQLKLNQNTPLLQLL